MPNSSQSTRMEDEHRISNLLVRWGHARDSDDWDTLAECFHDDATIHVSWMSGTAKDFVARSRAMAAKRRPGDHMKHVISGPWIRINQNRAFTRCHANLYVRITMDGHQFDLQSWIRFFDLVERRNDAWRIVKRTGIYEKDRLEPVDPRGVPKDFFSDMDLSLFPQSAKFLCYWAKRVGLTSSTSVISVYSNEERALREESEVWLVTA